MSYNEHLTAGLAGIWNCTTSEAAERIAPKRKRISQDSLREEIPWTAARCNRLLRTITSRVNILRKQSKLCSAGSSVREAQSSRNSSRCPSEEDASPPRKEHKPSAHDPEWVPGAETKTSSRTYGGKPRQKPAPRKADSGFSTPFVKRLLKNGPLSAAKSWPGATRADERPKKTLQLPVQLASRNEEAQRNLVRAFNNLLTATSSVSSTERVGARSLMSACLRRVPDYIDLELEDLDEDNEEDENITSTIYSELEGLGTNSGGGWSGLREVVRSHGLHYVRAAIDEGLIKGTRISELVSTCSKHGALSEADSLLQTWIGRDHVTKSGRVDDSHVALAKLTELRTRHNAPELFLRHHTDLVRLGHISLSDILRPGSTILKDMISALLRGPGQDAALAYLETAVIEDFTVNTTSLPVFSRLAGLLASLALAQTGDADSSKSDLDLSMVVHRVAITIAQYQGDDQDPVGDKNDSTSIARKQNNKIHPFVMASTLLQLTSQSKTLICTALSLNALVNTVAVNQNVFVKFAVNVALHVHRFSDADELESLLITTSGLLSPPVECSNEDRSTLNRLAFEMAFAYREQTGIEIDEHFFNSRVSTSNGGSANSIAQTPRRRVQVSGYKWEEGLCEWVAATPLAKPPTKVPAQSLPKQLLTPDKESNKSPLGLPPSPRVVISVPSSPQIDDTRSIPTRPALQERSANHQLQSSSQEKKPPSFLKPALPPKQVHLKEERAKKAAAALLAQQNASKTSPPPKRAPLKRSLSLANTSNLEKESGSRSLSVDTDELGMLTPARKKSKRVLNRTSSSSSFRSSLPAQMLDGMSEDELGL